jgi:OmcA/MtrC family decaheme c-type cytochrome
MGQVLPVGDITDPLDAHFIDTDPAGPETEAGYRQLDVLILSVDVTGMNVVINFDVTDELGMPVSDLFADDGRFTIALLVPGAGSGDPLEWQSLIETIEDPGDVGNGPGTPEVQATSESFGSGTFTFLGGASYRYTSNFDPSTAGLAGGETMRVAIQISGGDLPAGNGACDFDVDPLNLNFCQLTTTLTRDIVQTAVCNDCHGTTSDTQLAFHGGGRTEIEYCVTCHNPGTTDANSGNSVDMSTMTHKIHAGSSLANGYMIYGFRDSLHDYSAVNFTADLDDCATCHAGAGLDVDNWKEVPSREACGSCHDDVDFDTGLNHGSGGVQLTNTFCVNCHPASGPLLPAQLPVETVHLGAARTVEAALYREPNSGYSLDAVTYDSAIDQVVVDYSVGRSGAPMDLETAPEWTEGGSLNLRIAWDTSDYSNEGSGATPAQPVSFNALDIGPTGVAMSIGPGLYRAEIDRPSGASGSASVELEGRPVADLDGDGELSDRIPVASTLTSINVDGGRGTTTPRRQIVDSTLCNQCHDSGGAGLSIHGGNRVGDMQVCSICHNPDATDINRRPADPTMAPDGLREVSIDFKRMIHQIHTGSDLQNPYYVYGFGGSLHDFSTVGFIGNTDNCETCHLPGTYSTEAASAAAPSTLDTGADLADPSDDLNASPASAACASCHDSDASVLHMEQNGGSFQALDADIR